MLAPPTVLELLPSPLTGPAMGSTHSPPSSRFLDAALSSSAAAMEVQLSASDRGITEPAWR